MHLSPVMQRFILHWGEMGTRWGVNRSVAQIHALLYLAEESLPAETIADTLGIARSNVSTSLKELIGWELVGITHHLGDRRDHFHAKTDVWEVITTIADGRKRREIDPTVAMLETCVQELKSDRDTPRATRERIQHMLDFTRELSRWYEQVKGLPRKTLVALMRMGSRVSKILPG